MTDSGYYVLSSSQVMITIEKLNIYHHYSGDIDSWGRVGTKEEKMMMNDSDWYLIEGIIQDLSLVTRGLAADSYTQTIQEQLRAYCDSEETMNAIKDMV